VTATIEEGDIVPTGPAEPGARRRELALVGGPPLERADAIRNRRRILTAAEEIITTVGIDGLTMDKVAAAAGVGVGTVYRRFGDLPGLAYALLDESEREFQAAFLHGPPPLGPGAEPAQRIRAFLHALVDVTEVTAPLLLLIETGKPSTRCASPVYSLHHAHLAALIAEARPGADAHYLADALLAPLAASLFLYQRRERAMSIDRIKAGLDDLLTGLPLS
jgi:AcrR family transcriptional regulator